MRPSARRTISVLSGLRTVLADLTACDPADRPAAGPAAKILDGIAAGFDGSLSDEILMLGQPASEPDRPLLRRTFCSRRRRIIVTAVVLGGCGAFTATLGSSDSRPSEPPQAAPRAAAASLPRAPQNPPKSAPPKIAPPLRRSPAPASAPAQLAAGTRRGDTTDAGHVAALPKQRHAHPVKHGKAGHAKAGQAKAAHRKAGHAGAGHAGAGHAGAGHAGAGHGKARSDSHRAYEG
jgi:type IV secretory pathway VirB10-like protein